VLVANVTQVVIVASVLEPALKPPLIDRFLLSAAKGGVAAAICLNKADLVEADRPAAVDCAVQSTGLSDDSHERHHRRGSGALASTAE
jgi:putative ribosome biogenesis GTPase RsgA